MVKIRTVHEYAVDFGLPETGRYVVDNPWIVRRLRDEAQAEGLLFATRPTVDGRIIGAFLDASIPRELEYEEAQRRGLDIVDGVKQQWQKELFHLNIFPYSVDKDAALDAIRKTTELARASLEDDSELSLSVWDIEPQKVSGFMQYDSKTEYAKPRAFAIGAACMGKDSWHRTQVVITNNATLYGHSLDDNQFLVVEDFGAEGRGTAIHPKMIEALDSKPWDKEKR